MLLPRGKGNLCPPAEMPRQSLDRCLFCGVAGGRKPIPVTDNGGSDHPLPAFIFLAAEAGASTTTNTLLDIAEVLGVDLEALFGGSPKQKR